MRLGRISRQRNAPTSGILERVVRRLVGGSLGLSSIVLVMGLGLGVAGCADLDIIDHDALGADPEENFPTEAMARCGPLPLGIESIDELRTAWAISVVPVKDGQENFSVATSTTILRLSDQGVACNERLASEMLTCPDGWAADITIRKGEPEPGRFALTGLGQGFSVATAERDSSGSCGGEVVTSPFAAGEVEIYTVTEDCVVGRLINTAEVLDDAGAPVEGGFVALRCDAQ